jgi:hypothetical protein
MSLFVFKVWTSWDLPVFSGITRPVGSLDDGDITTAIREWGIATEWFVTSFKY